MTDEMEEKTETEAVTVGDSSLQKEIDVIASEKREVPTGTHDEKLVPVVASPALAPTSPVAKNPTSAPVSTPETPTPPIQNSVSQLVTPVPIPKPERMSLQNALSETAESIGHNTKMNDLRGRSFKPAAATPQPPKSKIFSIPQEGELPRIRTYATDMSEEIRKRGSTISSIVSAEQQKARKEGAFDDPVKKSNRIALFVAATLLLVVLGGVAIGVAFLTRTSIIPPPPHSALIPTNSYETIAVDADRTLAPILGDARTRASLDLGEAKDIVVTRDGRALTPQEILRALGAPDELARNATSIMIGVHAYDRNQPFILIGVTAYDRAFDSMLSWEARMNEGLGDFFKPSGLTLNSAAATPPALEFTDRVLQNIDIRESQQSWHIMYSFLRRDLILITTNDSTLREVVTRLALQKSK